MQDDDLEFEFSIKVSKYSYSVYVCMITILMFIQLAFKIMSM
jgi:hypothetical protein